MILKKPIQQGRNVLIFLAIILYLAFLSIPFMTDVGHIGKANTAKRAASEMKHIADALDRFYRDHHRYPLTAASRFIRDASLPDNNRFLFLTSPVAYINTYSADPFIGDGYTQPYRYYSDSANWFLLASHGPDGDSDIADRIILKHSDKPSFSILKTWIYNPSNGNLSDGDVIHIGL